MFGEMGFAVNPSPYRAPSPPRAKESEPEPDATPAVVVLAVAVAVAIVIASHREPDPCVGASFFASDPVVGAAAAPFGHHMHHLHARHGLK
jgi:hypothetical protein